MQGEPWACDASIYSSTAYAGHDWLLAGDAGSTVDPLSSFGVKKALISAWMGAVLLNTCLSRPAMRDAAVEFYNQREHQTFTDHARMSEVADEVLLKPFTPTQLRCAVANLRPAAELSAAPSPSPALRHQDYCRQTAFLPPLPRARASTPAQDAPDSAPTCQIRRRHR